MNMHQTNEILLHITSNMKIKMQSLPALLEGPPISTSVFSSQNRVCFLPLFLVVFYRGTFFKIAQFILCILKTVYPK